MSDTLPRPECRLDAWKRYEPVFLEMLKRQSEFTLDPHPLKARTFIARIKDARTGQLAENYNPVFDPHWLKSLVFLETPDGHVTIRFKDKPGRILGSKNQPSQSHAPIQVSSILYTMDDEAKVKELLDKLSARELNSFQDPYIVQCNSIEQYKRLEELAQQRDVTLDNTDQPMGRVRVY